MPRVRYGDLPARWPDYRQAAFFKPAEVPAGYTRNTVITEWLTETCLGDWASQSDGEVVRVRFADPEDHARALARFAATAASA